MKFFSGATATEVAAQNATTSGCILLAKQFLSVEANLGEIEPIINSESEDWLGTMNAIVDLAKKSVPAFSPYTASQVYEAVSRRLNASNKAMAVEHEFSSYAVMRKGKLKVQELALEHKPDAPAQAA
jgi:hypothetical protein